MITSLKLLKKDYLEGINTFLPSTLDPIEKIKKQFIYTSKFCDSSEKIFESIDFSLIDKADEIEYFKDIKSFFLGKIYFFESLLKLEAELRLQSKEGKVHLIEQQFQFIGTHQQLCSDFYIYVLSNSTDEDNKYYSKAANTSEVLNENGLPRKGVQFNCSTHERLRGKVLANIEFAEYLNRMLKTDEIVRHLIDKNPNEGIKWTGTNNDLIQLIRAIFATGCLNDGKITFKNLLCYFGKAFNYEIKLSGNYYRDAKSSLNPTDFIDIMKDSYLKKLGKR